MASTFGNRVTTITQDYYVPKLVDTVLNSNVLTSRVIRAAKAWRGERMQFPIKVSQNTTGTSFSGFDTFSTAASDTRILLEFSPRFYQISVALPLDEISVNGTEEKVLDLISVEMESSAQDMADDIGDILYGDGTGNSNKEFLGLGAIVDDGGAVATYGGQSRSTYTTLQATDTASSGTLTLAKMRTLWNAISSGSVQPTLLLSDETVWGLYEQLLQPQERINKEAGLSKNLKAGTGFTGLAYNGKPFLKDEKATSGYLFMLNEDFLDFYALPMKMTESVKYKSVIEGSDTSEVKGLGFSWSGWIKPTNQAAVVGHIYLGGNLISSNPKRHGRLTGITSV